MTKVVELHQAFLWTCDECGFDQFERAVAYVGPPLCADCHHPAAEHGEFSPWRPFCRGNCACEDFRPPDPGAIFFVAPARVQCSRCGAQSETTG